MFFRKSEPKKHNTCAVLIVGMLAAVGAITVFKHTKCIFSSIKNKMEGLTESDSCTCECDE